MTVKAEQKQASIRWKAQQNRSDPGRSKIYWSRHAIVKLVNEDWDRTLLEEALQNSNN